MIELSTATVDPRDPKLSAESVQSLSEIHHTIAVQRALAERYHHLATRSLFHEPKARFEHLETRCRNAVAAAERQFVQWKSSNGYPGLAALPTDTRWCASIQRTVDSALAAADVHVN